MTSESPKRILITPLDWGLGHATRMLSIVRWLSEEYTVYIAVPEALHFLFENENVKMFSIPGFNIRYGRFPIMLSLFFQLPKVFIRSLFTHILIKRIVKRLKPDLIISDNHPFVRHKKVPSVYITHQITIQHKNSWLKRLLNYFHHRYIHRFDECWVPDTENHDFAGDLSKGNLKIPVRYLGALSRFQTTLETQSEKFTKVCILSGPEPERTRWAKRMIAKWKNDEGALIIGVLKGTDRFEKRGGLTVSSHLNDSLFMFVLKKADEIYSRSGYSTIMDLAFLNKNGILVPTKGQTEQEYLAIFHKSKQNKAVKFMSRDDISCLVERVLAG